MLTATGQAIENMAAVELTYRQQIDSRHQQANPAGKCGLGEPVEITRRRLSDEIQGQQFHQDRLAIHGEGHFARSEHLRRDDGGLGQAVDKP